MLEPASVYHVQHVHLGKKIHKYMNKCFHLMLHFILLIHLWVRDEQSEQTCPDLLLHGIPKPT